MKLRSVLRAALPGALLGAMLAFPQEAAQAAREGLELWARAVLPALLPYAACLLLLTGGRALPSVLLNALCFLGGSPAGARLWQDAALPPARARALAALTGTMSPLFFLSTLALWTRDPAGARMLLAVHLLSALLCSLLFRPRARGDMPRGRVYLPPVSVPGALAQSAQAMLTVGVCIVLGVVASRLLARALPFLPPPALAALQCALEVTSGCRALIALSLPRETLLPLLSAACAFSGLAILLQNAAFWAKRGVGLSFLCLCALPRAVLAFALARAILLCIRA